MLKKQHLTKLFSLAFSLILLFCGCDAAKEILKDADKEDRKIEKKEPKQNTPTSQPTTPPKKDDRKVRDVPLSGKIDPDGLPVSNNEEMKKLEETTFPLFFNVDNDVTVRHRGLNAKQIETVKKYIKEAKEEFFATFNFEKNEPNAENDFTKGVIIDIFDTDKLYQELFPKLFEGRVYKQADMNAGMCFENNPSFNGNIMRIGLKIFTDVDGFEIINIKHEFTHYLDMRYNWASTGYEPNDWWMEGLAEYLGNPEDEKDAIKIVKRNKFTLKKIMGTDNEDNSNEKAADQKYAGGRLVIRFMFENHIEDINTFLEIIRNGDYDEKYNKWRKEFINKYNVSFSKWVVNLK